MERGPEDSAGERRLEALRPVIDRLIPPDDFPGAWEAGAGTYIARQLAGDLRHLAPIIGEGLAALDREALHTFGQPFAALPGAEQDCILARVEGGTVATVWVIAPEAFFSLLVRLTNEGYYGDPGNGGNQGGVAWRMIGYETRRPERRP